MSKSNQTLIRANQGHSVKSVTQAATHKIEHALTSPLLHGTSRKALRGLHLVFLFRRATSRKSNQTMWFFFLIYKCV